MATHKLIIEPEIHAISKAVSEIRTTLQDWKCKKENVLKAVLTIEEILVKLSQQMDANDKIFINMRKGLRKTDVKIVCRGKEFALTDTEMMPQAELLENTYDPNAVNTIRDIILRALRGNITAKYSRGVNNICVVAEMSQNASLIDAVAAIVLAVVVGIILRQALPTGVNTFLADNILQPMFFIFLRAMQLIMGPLIFFSLASSITGLSDLSSLGRTGAKIMGTYLLTTLFAICIMIGIDALMTPGDLQNIPLPDAGNVAALGEVPEISPSLKDTIVNLMPNNFLGTFVASDMLQIIVLAIIAAITIGKLGQYSNGLKKGIETMNEFFGTLTAFITKFLPLAIFGSFCNMILTIDMSSVGSLAYWGLAECTALFAMTAVYALLVLVLGGLNPLVFLRKYIKVWVTAFSSSSSSATMPTSLEACQKLGISPSIYSFSIPLGATVNMDGTSILFTGAALFLARLYGIDIEAGTMVTLITTVMLLSLATPGVPGAGTAAMLSVLAVVGVPAEGLTIVLGFCSLIELHATATNVTGDGAVTTIVAKSEKQLDKQLYYAK